MSSAATPFIRRLLDSDASWGPLVLRVPIGIIFLAHAARKLFGAFGGCGLEGTGTFMASLRLNPSYLMALLAGSAEFFRGLALVVGLLVRPAAALLVVTMFAAIGTVHLHKGFFMTANGYEFALALLAAAASVMVSGAYRLSVDGRLSPGVQAVHPFVDG